MSILIVRCESCDGYGWAVDDEGIGAECDWCGGIGYVYREGQLDRCIPPADYATHTAELERLEAERLRELGYSGASKHPDEQAIRKPKTP